MALSVYSLTAAKYLACRLLGAVHKAKTKVEHGLRGKNRAIAFPLALGVLLITHVYPAPSQFAHPVPAGPLPDRQPGG